MLRKILIFISVFLLFQTVFAQSDSIRRVKYSPGFRFKTGLYITHYQFINNSPIPLKRIVTKYDKSNFNFFDKLLSDETVTYYDNFGIKKTIKVNNLWGFCRRGSIYINWGEDFNRIPVIGNICHFIATITIVEDNYNPYYGYYTYSMPTTSSRSEILQFLMDFETGKVLDYSVDNVLTLLSDDSQLYEEYKALGKKKKKQMKFLYIRKYNEKHPIYIPVK